MNQQLWLNRTEVLIRHGWYSESRSVVSNSVTPVDCSLLGSSVHGILQARILELLPFPSPKVGTGGTTNTRMEKELTREACSEKALKGDGGAKSIM